MRLPPLRATVVTLAPLVLSACGSTVQPGSVAGTLIPQGSSQLRLGSSSTTAAGGSSTGSLLTRSGGTPGAVAVAAGSNVAPGPGGAPSFDGQQLSGAGANGPGITPHSVNVGMVYVPDADQYEKSLGAAAGTSGDVKSESEAIVRDINAHGGVAGRNLTVVYHALSASDTSSNASKLQAACADFTQDHRVIAAFNVTDRAFNACMNKAGSVVGDAAITGMTDRDFSQQSNYYDVQMLATDRAALNLVDALVQGHYFTGWDVATGQPGHAPVKVGILAPDGPDWSWTVPHVLIPELAKHGVRVNPSDVEMWHLPESTADDGQSVAQIQSAVLKFRSDGVTHVLPAEQNSSAFFAPAAQSQHYHPRYGVNTNSGFQAYAGSLIPYSQMNGAIGIGWSPMIDLPESENADNGRYAGPGRRHCLAVLKRAGVSFSSPNAEAVALTLCDTFYSAQRILDTIPVGTAINAASYMRALEGLGSTFAIAGLPAGRFGPGRHYPVTEGWRMAYSGSCQCMRYVGGAFPLR